MKLRILLLMLCTAVVFSSCKKSSTPAYNYTFVNTTGTPLNAVVYATERDYYTNARPVATYKVAVNGSVEMPSSLFMSYSTYYVDIFSDDYTIGNWKFPVEKPVQYDNSIIPTPQNNYLQLPTVLDYSRLVCINGNDTQTNWTAVGGTRFLQDSYGDPGTPWAQLTSSEQFIKMTMSKSHALTLYFTAPYAPSYGSNVLNIPWQVRADSASNVGNSTGKLYIRSVYDRDFAIYGTVGYSVTKSASGVTVNDTLVLNINLQDPTFFQGTFYLVRDNSGGNF